jgi:branched-chain amino acid transport system permease protein
MQFLQALASGIAVGIVYGVLALGFSVMYRTTGIINFAQGDLVVLGGYLVVACLSVGIPIWVALVISALVVGLFMTLVERLIIQRVSGKGVAYPIIVTVGLAIAIESSIQLVEGATPKFLPTLVPNSVLKLGSVRITHQQLTVFVICAVVGIAVILLVERTKLGRGLRAVAADRYVADLMGIPVRRYFAIAFFIGAAIAGLTGAMLGDINALSPALGLTLSINGFTAAVIGGLGNGVGALTGGLMLGVLENLAVVYASPNYKEGVAFIVLLLFLLVRPAGIFGEPAVNRREV